jgi:hypothetical protein
MNEEGSEPEVQRARDVDGLILLAAEMISWTISLTG